MIKNVLGTELQLCSANPLTGFTRSGCCETGSNDFGTHTVCAVMTEAFLAYTKEQGNDLSTPNSLYNFPRLQPGDKWCLCASRRVQALQAGVAPKLILDATHEKTLAFVSLDILVVNSL